jgi:transposase
VQEKRKNWQLNQSKLNPTKLVFLDESSINLGMTRLYGRAPVNERVNDYVPDVRFQRLSILSTVRLGGAQVPFVFDGTLNKELFKKYVEIFLVPTLSVGDILLLDNSSVHKANGVLDPIIERGVTVLFLPPYSPDFNPIEMLWSKMKSFLRKEKARTHETLVEAIKLALKSISVDDIHAWFKHDGYLSNTGNI